MGGTVKYAHETFEDLKSIDSQSHTSEHMPICETRCDKEGKDAFFWTAHVDLRDRTNISLAPEESNLGFFQATGCLHQCVRKGFVPQCPPMYCKDVDCQCCEDSMKLSLPGYVPMCNLLSASVQQHYFSPL